MLFLQEYKKNRLLFDSKVYGELLSGVTTAFIFGGGDVINKESKAVDEVGQQLKEAFKGYVDAAVVRLRESFIRSTYDARDIRNDKWREYYAKSIANNLKYLDKFKDDALKSADVAGFDFIGGLADFNNKVVITREKIDGWNTKIEELKGLDELNYLKKLLAIKNNKMARDYLNGGTFGKLDAFFEKNKDNKHKATFDKLKEEYFGDSGKLSDSEYTFLYPMNVLFQSSEDIVSGKVSLDSLFDGFPLINTNKKVDIEYPEAQSSRYGLIVGEQDAFLQKRVRDAEKAFSDLQLSMYQDGFFDTFDKDVPTVFTTVADNVDRVTAIYKFAKFGSMPNVRKYVSERFDLSFYPTMKQFFSIKYDFSKLPEGGGKLMAEFLAKKSKYDTYVAKWLDPKVGAFADGKTFEKPEYAAYLAMVALDEGAPMAEEIIPWAQDFIDKASKFKEWEGNYAEDAENSYRLEYFEYKSVYHVGNENVALFKTVFPKWGVEFGGVSETAAQAPGK